DDGRSIRLRGVQEPRRTCSRGQCHRDRGRLRVFLHLWMDRGQDVLALRAATQLRAIRMVANSGGRGRTRSAVYFLKSGQTFLELAGLAKTPEVRRHNRFYRGRVDAESLQRARLRR